MERFFNKTRVVGVGVSLQRTSYAIVDLRGHILAQESFETRKYPRIDDFVSELTSRLLDFMERNGGYESIRSVGISSPSGNYSTGCIENSPNMPWPGVIPLAAMMRDRLGMGVALANDCMAVALAEYSFGSAHGMDDFVVVSIGHGLGAAIFSHGDMVNGYGGFAGEIGHSCVVPGGRHCGCGLDGCLEQYVAEKGILMNAREILAESNEPSLMRDVPEEELTPEMITEFCEKGDRLAQEVYIRAGRILGLSLSNLSSIVNPEAIILTGGISRAGKWLLEPTAETFEKHLFRNIKGNVKILSSIINTREREILGASVLAWKVKEYSLFK